MKTKPILIVILVSLLSIFLVLTFIHPGVAQNISSINKVDFQRHEHPFFYIGSGFSQIRGDNRCRLILKQLKDLELSGNENKIGKLYAWDGKNITNSWHIWYHKKGGVCIANK